MKLGPSVIGIIIAGVLGYLLEPSVRPALLPAPKKVVEKKDEKGSSAPESPAQPATTPAPTAPAAPAWVATLTPEQLPAAVTLKNQASIPVAGAAAPMLVPAGVQVKPVRVEGNDLVINFAGTAEGKVAVMSTDLVQVLGNKVPEAPTAPPVAVADPAAPAAPAMPDPAAPAEPATPEPAEPAAPPVADKQLSPEEIVAVMQASVKAGEIKEFAFDQVLGWKADEDKDSGGVTYQTGLASYKAETIFGVKNIQAQALIKGGKVEKWIWPKSGMEIK